MKIKNEFFIFLLFSILLVSVFYIQNYNYKSLLSDSWDYRVVLDVTSDSYAKFEDSIYEFYVKHNYTNGYGLGRISQGIHPHSWGFGVDSALPYEFNFSPSLIGKNIIFMEITLNFINYTLFANDSWANVGVVFFFDSDLYVYDDPNSTQFQFDVQFYQSNDIGELHFYPSEYDRDYHNIYFLENKIPLNKVVSLKIDISKFLVEALDYCKKHYNFNPKKLTLKCLDIYIEVKNAEAYLNIYSVKLYLHPILTSNYALTIIILSSSMIFTLILIYIKIIRRYITK